MSSKQEEDYSWVWALIIPAIAGSIAFAIHHYNSPEERIKRIVRVYKMNSSIRAQAIKLARDLPDDVAKINAIFQFVVKIKYMRDPRGMDYYSNPLETLEIKAGDCDCQSILLASLLESIGYKTQFVLIPGHVFVRVFVEDHHAVQKYVPMEQKYITWPANGGSWIPLDPTVEGAYMGWIAEEALKAMKQPNVKFLDIGD